jgi:hypothetical protein
MINGSVFSNANPPSKNEMVDVFNYDFGND